MKKIQSVIYPFWIILSFLISIFLMIKLYPNYINNEFPLFTDLTLLLFLPAFFIFSYTLIHLLGSILSSIVAISNKWILPRFYVSTSKSIIKALINMRSFEIQLSPIG